METRSIQSIMHEEAKWFCGATGLIIVSFGTMIWSHDTEELAILTLVAAGVVLVTDVILAMKVAWSLKDDKVFVLYRAFELGIPIVTFWVLIAYGLTYLYTDYSENTVAHRTYLWAVMLLYFVMSFILGRWVPAFTTFVRDWTRTPIRKFLAIVVLFAVAAGTMYLESLLA